MPVSPIRLSVPFMFLLDPPRNFGTMDPGSIEKELANQMMIMITLVNFLFTVGVKLTIARTLKNSEVIKSPGGTRIYL